MAEDGLTPHQRDPIKSSVGNVAANRSRQTAVAVGKERRESLVRANVFVDWGLVAMTFLLKRT